MTYSIDLDGSHTPIRDGDGVKYQGRKKRKTINSLYHSDEQGLSLTMFKRVWGNLIDLDTNEVHFEIVTGSPEKAKIKVKKLFINPDAGF